MLTPDQVNSLFNNGSLNYDGPESAYRGNNTKSKAQLLEFNFDIINATGADKNVALNAAFYETLGITTTAAGSPLVYASTPHYHNTAEIILAGHSDVDAILDDGVIATSLTVTAKNKKIRDLRSFVKQNFCVLAEMQLSADTSAQWEQKFKTRQVSAFRNTGDDKIISLDNYYDPANPNTTKIVVPFLRNGDIVQFDDQTLNILGIGAGRTVKVSLKMLVVVNNAAESMKALLATF